MLFILAVISEKQKPRLAQKLLPCLMLYMDNFNLSLTMKGRKNLFKQPHKRDMHICHISFKFTYI